MISNNSKSIRWSLKPTDLGSKHTLQVVPNSSMTSKPFLVNGFVVLLDSGLVVALSAFPTFFSG